MKIIKAIIFDWGDTLSPGVREGYFPIERIKKRFELSDETIKQCLEIIDDFKVFSEPKTIKEQKQVLTNCYQSLVKQIKVKNSDSFIKYLLEWNLEKATPTLFPNVLDTVHYLFKKNYDLAILTNGWPTRLLEIRRSKVGKYFKTILVSGIIGARKPDIKAYQIAIKEIGVLASQILMVDNKESYLMPAKNLGISVLFMDIVDFNPDSIFPRIKDVSEVVDYL